MTQNMMLIDLPMPIRTPRLIIKPCEPGMGAAMHEAVQESREQLLPWMPWAHNETTPEKYEEIVRKEAGKFMAREDFMLVVFDHAGKLVASTGFHPINNFATPVIHIGYWCRTSEQGKGYVTEFVNALTRYAFDVMDMKKVQINVDEGNAASTRVAERNGFPLEYRSRFGIRRADTKEPMTLNVYSRFDTVGLPPLDVSWGL